MPTQCPRSAQWSPQPWTGPPGATGPAGHYGRRGGDRLAKQGGGGGATRKVQKIAAEGTFEDRGPPSGQPGRSRAQTAAQAPADKSLPSAYQRTACPTNTSVRRGGFIVRWTRGGGIKVVQVASVLPGAGRGMTCVHRASVQSEEVVAGRASRMARTLSRRAEIGRNMAHRVRAYELFDLI